MNGNPTAAQKRFHDWCRALGCYVQRGCEPVSIHHIKGAKMKLKGCKGAGEWYVLPLSYHWHQDGSNDSAIHVNRKKFEEFWEQTEKDIWQDLIFDYEYQFGQKPMSESDYKIIKDRA